MSNASLGKLHGRVNTRQIKNKKNVFIRFIEDVRLNKEAYLFMVPFGLIFLTFTVSPVVISIFLSFTNFNMLQAPVFAGLSNYAKMFFMDDVFKIAIKNTFLLAAVTGPISYIACLLFAWLINELRPKLRAVMTLIFYAPSISGAVFMIWPIIFSGDTYGYANSFLMKLGIIHAPIQWFTDVKYMTPLVIVVILWISLGTSFLSFIAGLQSVDKSMYEAGVIDGIRNRYQELWFITLPAIKPQLLFGAVMSITASFGIGPVITQLVGFPSTDYKVHTVVLHMQDYGGTRFEMGYACAIATVLFIVMVACNKIVQALLRRVGT